MKKLPLSHRRGMALVVVLVFLVLLSIFVVGFFSNSQDELTAAQSFTGEVSASHLSESAVSVVMGQIREATSRPSGAWGSQPGMIRVYRDGTSASSKADAFFKLYSSDDMIVGGSEIAKWDPANDVAEGAVGGWEKTPALWTNLNEPVTVEIPNASGTPAKANRYPILDPSLERQVEGLEFIRDAYPKAERSSILQTARMPVKWLYVLKDGTLTAPSGSAADGTQATWKKGEREPTAANPIVGRVAFWTDDETCKVNINTAGGYTLKIEDTPNDGGRPASISEDDYAGTFWDTPRMFTLFDRGMVSKGADSRKGSDGSLDRGGLALAQPVRGEFQRYPGHPSTTSLGIVFRGRPANQSISMQEAPYLLKSGQLALLSPRLMFSTTSRAERATNYGTSRLLATDYRGDPTVEIESNDQPLNFRIKRLYASVDELFYAQPDTAPLTQRKQNDWELTVSTQNDETKILTPEYLEKMRFFLTAHSRAPEVNLFGQPRVTIWPVQEVKKLEDEGGKNGLWNASDRLIAFCSTIGPDATKGTDERDVLRYLFQRADAYSPQVDINLTRNRRILSYLRTITDKPFPGFGGPSFRDKYKTDEDPSGREQVLVEIFDYIRTVNLRDSTRDKVFNEKLGKTTALGIQTKEKYKYAPRGLVVPTVSTAAGEHHGFGRFPTISEASIVLYHAGYVGKDGKRYRRAEQELKANVPLTKKRVIDDNGNFVKVKGVEVEVDMNLVRAFVVFETFNPMQGYAPTTTPNVNSSEFGSIVYELENLDDFKFDHKSLGMPPTAKNHVTYSSGSFYHGRNSGGSEGIMHTLWLWADPTKGGAKPTLVRSPKAAANPASVLWYPFQSKPDAPGMVDPLGSNISGIPIPLAQKEAELTGAKLTLKMRYSKAADIVRDIELDFPTVVVPVPTDEVWKTVGANGTFVARHPGGFFKDPPGSRSTWGSNQQTAPILSNSFGDWIDSSGTIRPGRLTYCSGDSQDRTGYNPPGPNNASRWNELLQPGDVVRSLVYGKGDLRTSCVAVSGKDAAQVFAPHPDYKKTYYGAELTRLPQTDNIPVMHAQTLRTAQSSEYYPDAVKNPRTFQFDGLQETRFGAIVRLPSTFAYPDAVAADLPSDLKKGVLRNDGAAGDFDTGIGSLPDGPFLNKADEGNLAFRQIYRNLDGTISHYLYPTPYFTWSFEEAFDTFFSPNRQTPSPVVFGSLLSGRSANWQTLCFSPNPAGANHPGRVEPKDYLWLDLFTMPVVEPYAISEPFSTAGKINLNYPIVPFVHIKRSTGLRAALQPVRVTAMPVSDVLTFKSGQKGKPVDGVNYRYLVDRDQTVQAFDEFFDEYKTDHSKGFIKVGAQICDFYLYPRQERKPLVAKSKTEKGDARIKQWWVKNALTGDNLREKPYADLYPRITTKSNTFCVHVRAQALRQSAASDAKKAEVHYRTWDEKRDRVIGEYRGASIIERYVDPQDERFNLANPGPGKIRPDIESIDPAYRFRVLNTKRFDP